MDLRQASRVRISFREPNGRPTPGLFLDKLIVSAPAGVRYVRLLVGETSLKAGRRRVVIAFRQGGRDKVVRIPIRTT